jgi:DNA-binding transcriptional LysR family regulator
MNTSFDWSLLPTFLAALERAACWARPGSLKASASPPPAATSPSWKRSWRKVLFERTGRGLLPTALALRLAGPARAMQSGRTGAGRACSTRQAQQAGTVRLSASQPVACYLLPPVLARMREALPAIQVELVASNQVSNLLQREADIALRMVQPDQASLVAKRIGEVSACRACAHQAYLRRRGMPRQPPDLLQHELVGYDRRTTSCAALQPWATR